MPDSVIKKVEGFARDGARAGALDFTDRSGILFEWNEAIDEAPEGLVEEDVVPYPSIAAELPGVALEPDAGVAPVEDKTEPHGGPEDAAAANAGLDPIDVSGVGGTRRAAAVPPDEGIGYNPNDDDIIAIYEAVPVAPGDREALIAKEDDDDSKDNVGSLEDGHNTHPPDNSDDEEEDEANDGFSDEGGAEDVIANKAELRRLARANKGQTT